jgi:hypothetical protein
MLESQIVLGWLERGRQQGVLKIARETLLEFIENRLQNPVPEEIRLTIQSTMDPQILRDWFRITLRMTEVSELLIGMQSVCDPSHIRFSS